MDSKNSKHFKNSLTNLKTKKRKTQISNNFLQSCSPVYLLLILEFILKNEDLKSSSFSYNSSAVLQLLKVSKTLYQKRQLLFSQLKFDFYVDPIFLHQIQEFNFRSVYLHTEDRLATSDISILEKMTNLRTLQIIPVCMTSLISLTQIESLALLDISQDLSFPKNLKSLKVYGSMTNPIVDSLIDLEVLEITAVLTNRNSLKYPPKYPPKLKKLKTLQKHVFSDIKHLQYLQIFKCLRFVVSANNCLPNLVRLNILDWKEPTVENLTGLINLQKLKLGMNRTFDISALCGLKKLCYFQIKCGMVECAGNVRCLASMPQLRIFKIREKDCRISGIPIEMIRVVSKKSGTKKWCRKL